MPHPRLAIRLAELSDALGVPEALVGDVLEEAGRGRSRLWIARQLVGLYGFAAVKRLRKLERPSPAAIALALGVLFVLTASVASARAVVAVWLVFYYVTGALSLFTQMADHKIGLDTSSPDETNVLAK